MVSLEYEIEKGISTFQWPPHTLVTFSKWLLDCSLHCLVVQCSVRHLSECDFPRGITASKITYIDLFHYFQPDAKWRKTQRRRRESAARRSLAAAIPEALEVRRLLNPVWEKSLSPLQTFHGKCSATPNIFQHLYEVDLGLEHFTVFWRKNVRNLSISSYHGP